MRGRFRRDLARCVLSFSRRISSTLLGIELLSVLPFNDGWIMDDGQCSTGRVAILGEYVTLNKA